MEPEETKATSEAEQPPAPHDAAASTPAPEPVPETHITPETVLPAGCPTVTVGQDPSQLPAAAAVTPPVEVTPAAFGLEPPAQRTEPVWAEQPPTQFAGPASTGSPAFPAPEATPAAAESVLPAAAVAGAASFTPQTPPAATPYAPPVSAPEEATGPAGETGSEPDFGGPNWMLAFVCAWAGVTALNEAWAVLAPVGLKAQILRNTAFLGYGLLGLGLVFFALEALRWGARRRNMLLAVVVPALMTLAGVAALIMSQDPGRRI